MVKELLTLIFMLFKRINENDTISVKIMRHFPFKGYVAMMWCGAIICREENANHFNDVTINHEMIHLCQAREKGCWILYYISYLWNWAKHNPLAPSSYYLNKYEGEAHANEDNFEYPKLYTGDNLYKYDLGRSYWRKYPSVTQYKNFIKTL